MRRFSHHPGWALSPPAPPGYALRSPWIARMGGPRRNCPVRGAWEGRPAMSRIVAVLCGAVLAAAAAPLPTASALPLTRTPAVSAQVADAQQQILVLVNARRAKHGCAALTASPQLNGLAESYSTEMGTEDFFSHTDPSGRTPWDRARALGIGDLGGENIAEGQPTPRAVMSA